MSVLFQGVYSAPDKPLWLSATNNIIAPANITVSSITTSASGGLVLTASTDPAPATQYGSVSFARAGGNPPTLLEQNVSKNVPTKATDFDYLTVSKNAGTVYDDLALAGLQIYGNQVTSPAANTGAAGYLTQGDLPYSVTLHTGIFTTGNLKASAATVSTLTVSSLTETGVFNSDIFNASTVNTNFFNTNQAQFSTLTSKIANIETINSSTITAEIVNVSTLRASTFSILNNAVISSLTVSTLGVTNANLTNLSVGTMYVGLATISSLNTKGGDVITSTLVSENLSTVTAVLKEMFVSTMSFNATVSPNIDLGLGSLVGGIVGAVGANALSIGLGAAGLGTGIAGLALARKSGTGIDPTVFQTINGTSQLQFSTLGQPTLTVFTLTDELDYTHAPGSTIYTSTIIPAGSRAVRTVSDPLNLANSDGGLGLGIQGYSQWESIYPGTLQLNESSITTTGNGSKIIMSSAPGANISIIGDGGLFMTPRVDGTGTIQIDATSIYFNSGNLDVYESVFVGRISTLSSIQGASGVPVSVYPGIITSTLTVSSLTVGATTQPTFVTSTLTTGTLSVTNSAAVSQTVRLATNGGQLGSLGVFVGQTVLNPPVDGNSMSVQNDIQCETLGARSLLFTRGGVIAQGASQLSSIQAISVSSIAMQSSSIATNVLTAPSVITNLLSGLGMTPSPPISGTYGTQWGTFVIAGLRIMWGITNGNQSPPYYSTGTFTPNFGGVPLVFLTSLTFSNVPSWWSVVNVAVNGFTSLGLNEPGRPFAAACQWLAIGPA